MLAAVLGGCTLLPEASSRTPIDAGQLELPALEAGTGLSQQSVEGAWWSLFNDPLLEQLETEVASTNLDLQAAVARVEQGRARLGITESAQGIQVDGSVGYSRSRLSEYSRLAALGASTAPSDYWTLGIQAGWELDLWGHLSSRTLAAKQRLQATEYELQGVRVSVSAEVARTYLLLRGVQGQLRLARQYLSITRELLDLQQSRKHQGVATDYDMASASAAVSTAAARIPVLEDQREQLMNALALLVGKGPGALNSRLGGDTGLPGLPEHLPVGLPSELARRRPDILAAEARLRAATADMAAARADFYPRITLGISGGMEALESGDFGSWGSRTFALGPSLYLPIFQGGRLHRMLELTEAGAREAAIDYRQTVLGAWHEVNNAMTSYQESLRKYRTLEAARRDTDLALESVRRARRHGYASRIQELKAGLDSLAQEQSLTEGATRTALSVVALYRALGGGWQDEMVSGGQGD